MTASLLLLALIAFSAIGTSYIAHRLPRSAILTMMAFAGVTLVVFIAASVHAANVGEADGLGYAMAMWFLVTPLSLIGTPFCVGIVIGAAVGLARK